MDLALHARANADEGLAEAPHPKVAEAQLVKPLALSHPSTVCLTVDNATQM
jgi:hypothetical protein